MTSDLSHQKHKTASRFADVLVVGAGPTGLLLTHLLAKQGVRVCLMDQLSQVVDEARAVSIDDESLRSLADALQLDRMAPLITHAYGGMIILGFRPCLPKLNQAYKTTVIPKEMHFVSNNWFKLCLKG